MAHIGNKTNEMMSGLICNCGHDYVCHAQQNGGCCECGCYKTRMNIVDDYVATQQSVYPKQEEVQEFDLGGGKSAVLVELTNENRPAMFEISMSMYLDDECMYCHRNFTREELKTAVIAYPNKFGRIVHNEYWQAAPKL